MFSCIILLNIKNEQKLISLSLKETNVSAISNKFMLSVVYPLQSRGYCIHSLECKSDFEVGGFNPLAPPFILLCIHTHTHTHTQHTFPSTSRVKNNFFVG